MTDYEEQVPPLVEILEDSTEQVELPLVGDVQPTEPQPQDPEEAPNAEPWHGRPPIPVW
jgi:hypothetical protein